MTSRLFVLLIATFLFTPYAQADENPLKIETTGMFIPKSDIHSQPGHIAMGKANIRIKKRFMVANDLTLDVAIGGNHYLIDDKSPMDLPDSFKSRGLHLATLLPLDEVFSIGVGINPSFQTAGTMDFSTNGFRLRSHLYLNIKQDETLTIKLGATYRQDYEAQVFPYIGLAYQATDKLAFLINSDESSIASRINYALTDANTVFTRADYELDEFVINRGARKNTVIRYQDIVVGVGLEHRFCKYFTATINGGGVLNRKIDYTNGDGKILPKTSPYVGIDARVSF